MSARVYLEPANDAGGFVTRSGNVEPAADLGDRGAAAGEERPVQVGCACRGADGAFGLEAGGEGRIILASAEKEG